MVEPPHPALAPSKVRHVGDQVAMVIAETKAQAKDAAELVEVDYEALPAVADTADALKPGAPLVWDEAPGNVCFDWHLGDKAATDAAFAKAAHVVKIDLINNRLVPNAMEPRAANGDYDRGDRRLHALHHVAEPAPDPPAAGRLHAQRAGAQAARRGAGRRRRLRLEDLPLRRGAAGPLGVEARSAGR